MMRPIATAALLLVAACGGSEPSSPPASPAAVEAFDVAFELDAAAPGSTVLVADGIWLDDSPTTFELEVEEGSAWLRTDEEGHLVVEELTLALTGLDHDMWDGAAHMDDLALTLEEPVALTTTGDDEARAEGELPLRVDWWIETENQVHGLASQEVDLAVELTISGTPDEPQLDLHVHREGEVFAIDGVFDVSAVDLRIRG